MFPNLHHWSSNVISEESVNMIIENSVNDFFVIFDQSHNSEIQATFFMFDDTINQNEGSLEDLYDSIEGWLSE